MSLPAFSFSTTADEAATALKSEIAGKNVLVTGTSIDGIGFEAARVIAKHASLVIIAGHNLERLKLAEKAIKESVPAANIRVLVLDLSSLAAVRKAAAEVNAYAEPLHVLIHNAAATGGELQFTEDGLEIQIAVDHVGPFLLNKLLLPKLLAAASPRFTPRVVYVSSLAHSMGTGIDFAHLRRPAKEVENDFMKRYHEAKTANVLSAIELSKRAKGKLHVYSLHPGSIFTKGSKRPAISAVLTQIGFLDESGQPSNDKIQWKTMEQGAATTVVAAFDPRLNDKSGAYLADGAEANKDVAPHASDAGNAEKLWTMTEEIIGEKFEL